MNKAGRRLRVLFIGEAITLSHIARPAVLATSLPADRYEAFFACDRGAFRLVGDLGSVQPIELDSRMANVDLENFVNFRQEFFDFKTLDHYIQEDTRLFREYRPDVVVGDMRLSLMFSARLAGIPYVNIQNCHWHPRSGVNLRLPANPFSAVIGDAAATLVVNMLAPAATVNYNLLSMKYGVPAPGPDFRTILCSGDYLLFPDIPEWSPLPQPPANAAYVGPLVWAPGVAPPDWWDTLDPDRPTIYVSLGSSGQVRLLRAILEALAGLGFQVIAATASRSELGALPANVFAAAYVDGIQAAARSQLAICNGGSMSGPQALSVGCPIIGITSNMDQAAFMQQVARTGAGVEITEAGFNLDGLTQRVREMTGNPGYRQAALRLKAAIARTDRQAALDRILQAAAA
ncbi:MAG: glycosyl transferase family 1 [Alphaproteobacteria bacterium]|jgi:UDP:flavonoid glycosyltransferase YjiC (YdhE family)|nr:glycosyl transferase family 1 [Alphaproteobacteria bacterium]